MNFTLIYMPSQIPVAPLFFYWLSVNNGTHDTVIFASGCELSNQWHLVDFIKFEVLFDEDNSPAKDLRKQQMWADG